MGPSLWRDLEKNQFTLPSVHSGGEQQPFRLVALDAFGQLCSYNDSSLYLSIQCPVETDAKCLLQGYEANLVNGTFLFKDLTVNLKYGASYAFGIDTRSKEISKQLQIRVSILRSWGGTS
eukprot:TRINITY_DN4526_c1_g1_i1.p1 TRINITY_DN4526_c1_g1~~TRINITY_DN4526_c1_g1_i1.p1  ORF type:complete len:120 (-),score=6.10 TRINITY_DN4526_c1_g1_i1:80-439(-)